MRLVSLLPSATEIVYALGLGDDLVGVTFECEVPASYRAGTAVVVGGRDTRGMSPGEIDAYVKGQLAAGADLYTLHAGALAGLDPDLILTQDLCRVCALPSGRVADAVDHLGCRAEVLSLDPYTLDDVLESIRAVGAAARVPDRAEALVDGLRARRAAVGAAVAGRPRRRVAVVEWVDPPFGAGHWIPDLVDVAGGTPVATHPGARSTPTTWADLRAAGPEVVLVAPCGFHLDGAADQAAASAVGPSRDPEVQALDADGLIVRAGPTWSTAPRRSPRSCTPTSSPAPPGIAVLFLFYTDCGRAIWKASTTFVLEHESCRNQELAI
ncbi:ABC transporter substrate-binding protein [Micromonospora sp. WMMD718]|uniref:ABC transporter substrate-binding protein n=1 Tax=unclassified Micromonospora TaxID=2617518 RepID=UPI000AD8C8CF|nr:MULTISPECIES: ABC transporter substrate-binding protein [unclassified Micromonospora]MDG4751438.1 ABC transporter substrate-binding protein [Micromonospora sp. WMMD718]